MSNCCAKNKPSLKRHICPENKHECAQVPYQTLLHNVKAPWAMALAEQHYYFCDDPECDVVYFTAEGICIYKDQLRTKVGIKEIADDQALICYCFDVSKATAADGGQAKAFVMAQTKKSLCACVTRNPSGKCCLKDFPK